MSTAFDTFDDTVRTYLAKTFNNLGLQYTHSQVFGVIFDGIKGIMQNMMFYIEDALNEQNVFSATRKNSVYSLAKISGYEAFYGSAPTGILVGRLKVNNGLQSKTTKVYVHNHDKVLNRSTGITYSIVLPTDYYVYDVSKPLITHEFKIVQGMFTSSTYVASGLEMETINLYISDLFDREYLKVTVDGKTWERVYNFYDMTDDGEEYIIQVGYNNTIDIIFGNGIYGRKLQEGQTVLIEYLRHAGDYGNILPNSISDFVWSDYSNDILGNPVDGNDYMSLTLESCVSGGTDSDSIEFIRTMIGANSRALVLASEDNYRLFFRRFSFIGYVNCWSDTNSMIVNATCLRNIENEIQDTESYYALDIKNMLITDEQKQMIINTLNNSRRAFAGVTLRFEDPIIRRFAFICYVKIDSVYNKDLATTKIREELARYFMNLDTDCTFIPKSDFVKLIIDNVDCVRSIDFDIISELAEQTYFNGYYDKYTSRFINGTYTYTSRRVIYESDMQPGLDNYGNISLDSKLEIPVLHGGFKYYMNKDQNDRDTSLMVDAVQIYFI